MPVVFGVSPVGGVLLGGVAGGLLIEPLSGVEPEGGAMDPPLIDPPLEPEPVELLDIPVSGAVLGAELMDPLFIAPLSGPLVVIPPPAEPEDEPRAMR